MGTALLPWGAGVKLVRLSVEIEEAVRELAAEYEAEGIERFEAILQD